MQENGVKVQRLEGVSTEGTEGDLEELETVFKDLTLPHSRREFSWSTQRRLRADPDVGCDT